MRTERLEKVAALAAEVAVMAKAIAAAQRARDKAFAQVGGDYDQWRSVLDAHPGPSPRDTAALRRRSMDLTRALADMRRP